MYIMDRTGHSTITWDPNIGIEVNTARDAFNKLIREGYQAFRVEGSDNRGARITEFDAKVGKLHER